MPNFGSIPINHHIKIVDSYKGPAFLNPPSTLLVAFNKDDEVKGGR